jgi:hypothetical protein
MKEALKVECLRWCNQGQRFDEAANFIVRGYVYLANFMPDELAERASPSRRRELIEKLKSPPMARSDSKAQRTATLATLAEMKDNAQAGITACDWREARMSELNIEWNLFVERFRSQYVAVEEEVDAYTTSMGKSAPEKK